MHRRWCRHERRGRRRLSRRPGIPSPARRTPRREGRLSARRRRVRLFVQHQAVERLLGACASSTRSCWTCATAMARGWRCRRAFPAFRCMPCARWRPDVARCSPPAGMPAFTGVLVEGVDNAVAGEWIAARTAQVARGCSGGCASAAPSHRSAATGGVGGSAAPRRHADPRQDMSPKALRVTRRSVRASSGQGGAEPEARHRPRPSGLRRRPAGESRYTVRCVVRILGYASPSHLAGAARRVAGRRRWSFVNWDRAVC